jgi:quinol monooxygenase YgiN
VSVVVVATITPLPGHRDEVIEAFTAVIPQVHAEDGCELYALNQTEDRLIMIEKWASPDALAAHSKGAALASLNPQLKGKVAGRPDVIVLNAVPAGDATKGAL